MKGAPFPSKTTGKSQLVFKGEGEHLFFASSSLHSQCHFYPQNNHRFWPTNHWCL